MRELSSSSSYSLALRSVISTSSKHLDMSLGFLIP